MAFRTAVEKGDWFIILVESPVRQQRVSSITEDPRNPVQHEPEGDCWDNAVAAFFFRTLKVELIHDKIYNTRQEANGKVQYICKRFSLPGQF